MVRRKAQRDRPTDHAIAPQTMRSPHRQPPLTWAKFVQQGGRPNIQVDFDLPSEFRNGPVYFNTRANKISAVILKQGLRHYPPIQTGPIELNDEYMPRLVIP